MKMSVEVFLVLFWVRGSATFCCVKFWGLVSVKPRVGEMDRVYK